MGRQFILYLFFLVLLMECKEPFNPPEILDFDEILVVDANVNGTTGEASVVLSISQALNVEDSITYVNGAEVYFQTEEGAIYYLSYNGYGEYIAHGVHLEYGNKIQLFVTLSNGNQYVSEYEEFKKTPEIDSVTFEADEDGVHFFVTTHDPENNSFYYKWEYVETWLFKAAYESLYTYGYDSENNMDYSSITARDEAEVDSMQYCFKDQLSTKIMIGSSKNLYEDVINRGSLFTAGYTNGEFQYKYSLLVKQHALTERSYNYWNILASNTEGLGSIFDQQPSESYSNIASVNNPEEKVLGFFSVYSETQKRIFINYNQVPPYEASRTLTNTCTNEFLKFYDGDCRCYPLMEQIAGLYLLDSLASGCTVASPICCDCKLTGYHETPDFWE